MYAKGNNHPRAQLPAACNLHMQAIALLLQVLKHSWKIGAKSNLIIK